MVLHLPDDLADDLMVEANKRGTTAEQLAIHYIRQHILPSAPNAAAQGMTMLEYLSDVIGVVDSREIVPGGARLSEDTGKKFAELMLAKRAQGKL